jgi:dipeptidyl aminopeptidase/acylaminoacyl peptidase
VRVPFEGGPPEDVSPDLPPYASFSLAFSGSANHLGFVTAGAGGFKIYGQPLRPRGELGDRRLLFQHQGSSYGPALSYNGDTAVIAATERDSQRFNLAALDTANGQRLAELWDGPQTSLEFLGFSPLAGDGRLLASTNRTGVRRPLIWNPRTGERIDLGLDELQGEVVPLDWSPDGNQVLLMQVYEAVQRLYVYNLAARSLARLNHPGGTYGFYGTETYFGPPGEIFTQWEDSTHPSRLIALDSQTGAWRRTVLAAGEAPPGHPWKPVSFPSSDGTKIQGWLSLPEGAGPFPLILETHGGPAHAVTDWFHPGIQMWLDHGFACLTINYRGSTTFGRDFQEKILGDLGHWEMEDMAGARDWLVREGPAIPEQILLTGWSYGGYLTLLGLGKRPELWAGGMAGVAVADWVSQYEDEAETLRGYDRQLFGGTPEEKPEQYAAASPITYAEAVRAPVLVIQGRNDTRCPARQVEEYEARLKALGKPIELHWFDAGHMGAGVEQSIQHHELMLRFACRVINGER